jgi:hypothetical protein
VAAIAGRAPQSNAAAASVRRFEETYFLQKLMVMSFLMPRLQAARSSTTGINTIDTACPAFANGIGVRCSVSGTNVVAQNFKRYWWKSVFAASDAVAAGVPERGDVPCYFNST